MSGDNRRFAWLRQYPFEDLAATFTKALGTVLADTRSVRGYTSAQTVAGLSRDLGDRTLLSYEHGIRRVPVERLLELCIRLDAAMPGMIEDALTRTRRVLEQGPPPVPGRDAGTAPAATAADDEVATIKQALASVQGRTAELERGRRAITQNQQLKDKVAQLQLELSQLRTSAEVDRQRAEAAEDRLTKLREKLVDAAARHAEEIARLNGTHDKAMRELEQDARAALVDARTVHVNKVQQLMREHADRMERVVSGRPPEPEPDPPAPEPEPAPDPRFWRDVVRDMEVAEDADPYLRRAYYTLTSQQRFILGALVYGKTPAALANAMKLSNYQVDAHVNTICRRFRKSGDPEIREADLKGIGRELFGVKGASEQ